MIDYRILTYNREKYAKLPDLFFAQWNKNATKLGAPFAWQLAC
jgi:hypothetical protein